jgi:predicted kinase
MAMETNRPVLVLMAGLPGSGKSTLALEVGRRLGWPVVDKDTVKSGLLGIGAEEELAAQASYVLLHELAHDLVVGQGLSVILDTPSSYERVIEACTQIAEEGGGALFIVLCEATRETRAHRLATRERQPSHIVAIDEEAEVAIQKVFDGLPEGTLKVSTEGPAEELVDYVVAHILEEGSEKG